MDESMRNDRTEDRRQNSEVSMGEADTLKNGGVSLGRIDQYELLRELGGGGFGTVYLARDTVAGVDVAVKGLPPLVKNNADELERIRENFALVSKLHHPHIAAALHLHQAKETRYADERVRQVLRVQPGDCLMVMAYAPGVTLNKWRKQFPEGKVPAAQALEVCLQIAEALDYAHGERVVHRDVKPSNVMVETREASSKVRECESSKVGGTHNAQRATLNAQLYVRVLDFGLAAEIRSSMSRVSQEKGDTSGTRPYMAPEQWAGRKQDGRTDQYALAALFYELVGGAVPFASAFDTGDPVIMSNAAENKAPEPLAGLSKAQNAALLRGLAKEPRSRFADCGDFIKALSANSEAVAPNGFRNRRISFLAVAAVIALSGLSYVSCRAYRFCQATVEARQNAKKLNAEQREKADSLSNRAELALTKDNLKEAGAAIAELETLNTSQAANLRKRLEDKAGERDATARYAEAKVTRDELQKTIPDPRQGMGERMRSLSVRWEEAETARQNRNWGQAVSGYDAVLDLCKNMVSLQEAREGARAQKAVADVARTEAANAGAERESKEALARAGDAYSHALAVFETGDFVTASNEWAKVGRVLLGIKKQTEEAGNRVRNDARNAFNAALMEVNLPHGPQERNIRNLLDRYAGKPWSELMGRLNKASEGNDKFLEASLWKMAAAALPEASKAAEAAIKSPAQVIVRCSTPGAEVLDEMGNRLGVASVPLGVTAWESQKLLVRAPQYVSASLALPMLEAGSLHTETAELSRFSGPTEGELCILNLGYGVTMELVWIPPGTTKLGSDSTEREWATGTEGQAQSFSFTNEGDVCTVRIPKGFWLGRTEVTIGQWKRFADATGYKTDADRRGESNAYDPSDGKWKNSKGSNWRNPGFYQSDEYPAVCITWNDAVAYTKWVSEKQREEGLLPEDFVYRLPTEAEWAYACRGGKENTKFWWGDRLSDGEGCLNGPSGDNLPNKHKWTLRYPWDDGYAFTAPCGSFGVKGRNGFGLADMLGNVSEWCLDRYDALGAHETVWMGKGYLRVSRGYAFNTIPGFVRCAARTGIWQFYADANQGFRVCLGYMTPDALNTKYMDAGLVAASSNQYTKAEAFLRKGLIEAEKLGDDNYALGQNLYWLGCVYTDTKKYAEADLFLRRALPVLEKTTSKNNERIGIAMRILADINGIRLKTNLEEAEQMCSRAAELFERIKATNQISRTYVMLADIRQNNRDLQGAIAAYTLASQNNPSDTFLIWNRGTVRSRTGDHQGALADYQRNCDALMQKGETNLMLFVINSCAWNSCTSTNSALRSTLIATNLAERAVEVSNRKEPQYLDTLAAAYAEAGQYERAVQTQKEALGLLTNAVDIADYTVRLRLFETGQPYRDVPKKVGERLNRGGSTTVRHR